MLAVAVVEAIEENGVRTSSERILIDMATGKERMRLTGAPVVQLVFSGDGKRLTGFNGGWPARSPEDVTLWDLNTGLSNLTRLNSPTTQSDFDSAPWARPSITVEELGAP